MADIESKSAIASENIILLWENGFHYHHLETSKNYTDDKQTHKNLDNQSLIDSKAWTELLKRYPEIIQRTISYLEDRIPQISSGEKKELQEWKHILGSMSLQRLKKFLESDSERSSRLRQSLPFWPVLKDSERAKLEQLKSEQKGHE
ncbi:MAG: hypothetical protein U5J63_09485 [Fodinibius sp.]|nr:hypothetical protein [Fodinibius sp.]